MSEIIRLPAVLPGELDLSALNERLRKREAALDWSGVRTAPAAALKELLQGLDLSDSADALGLGTVPEELIAGVDAVFTGQPALTSQPVVAPGESVPPEQPAVWSGSDEPLLPPVDSTPGPSSASAPAKILRKLSGLEIRSELEKKVLLDLHGPAGGAEEELVEATVRDRYILGTLAPSGVELPAEEQDGISGAATGDDEDGRPDQDGGGRATLLPSSLGLTFRVEGRVDSLQVNARWGRYVRQRSESQIDERTGQGPLVWKRIPVEAAHAVVLREGALELWSPFDQTPDVQVRGQARRSDGDWVVSLFLVNGQPAPPRGSREGQDSAWLFQAEMDVTAAGGGAVFLRRQGTHAGAFQAQIHTLDERIVDMLYRDVVEFAVGHGVGVHADVSADPGHAVRLYTRAVPRFEVGRTTPPTPDEIPALSAVERDMKLLSTLSETEIVPKLLPLAEAYASWIALRAADIERPDTLLEGRREEALAALERCREAEQRIRAGIALLSHDPHATEAFRFLNRAMWLQRVRTKLTERIRRGDDVVFEEIDIPANRSWFPFQLAFILVCLPGITGLDHADRGSDSEALADLLWFPTGGGKTEAYLGLSAYVMALRRLQGPIAGRSGEYGVAVLMRYTLRLLTLQQFQRASALLCACESIRLENPKTWGSNPFRIGLWVGKRVTPNTTEQSSDAIRRAHGDSGWGTASRSGSPYQLVYCPWCGQKIDPGRDIVVESVSGGRGRTLQYCGDQLGRCLFSRANSHGEGLPIVVVDEEVYRLLPALVIATVDKFAQMPWNGPVEMLFGQMNGRCDRHGFRSPDLDDRDSHRPTRTGLPAARTLPSLPVRPPDLIIQDELHLISGPLGTLVGLYETAVDRLCSWEVAGKMVRPKVIASTATIRRAGDQTHALFRRQVRVFPPRASTFEIASSPASEFHPKQTQAASTSAYVPREGA